MKPLGTKAFTRIATAAVLVFYVGIPFCSVLWVATMFTTAEVTERPAGGIVVDWDYSSPWERMFDLNVSLPDSFMGWVFAALMLMCFGMVAWGGAKRFLVDVIIADDFRVVGKPEPEWLTELRREIDVPK